MEETLNRVYEKENSIGYAVKYQCIKSITSIYPNNSLLSSTNEIVYKIMKCESNTLKYMGIKILILLLKTQQKFELEHQIVVLDCLESEDETLKREALELLYRMTNKNNVNVIITKLENHLKMCYEENFKRELVNKIIYLCEKFSPNQEFYFIKMINLFNNASKFITLEILNNVLKLIEENFKTESIDYADFLFSICEESFNKKNCSDCLMKVFIKKKK